MKTFGVFYRKQDGWYIVAKIKAKSRKIVMQSSYVGDKKLGQVKVRMLSPENELLYSKVNYPEMDEKTYS